MSAFSRNPLGVFRTEGVSLDYGDFFPRLYNLCCSIGLSRSNQSLGAAFCPDQDQGRATLMLTKHFGVFPVELGNIDGTLNFRDAMNWVARSNDIVLLQTSHVLRNSAVPPSSGVRGLQVRSTEQLTVCGTMSKVLAWYQREYQNALGHVRFVQAQGKHLVEIDTVLLEKNREDGLCLNLNRLVEKESNGAFQVDFESDSKVTFHANAALPDKLFNGQSSQVCKLLYPEWFSFNTSEPKVEATLQCAEANLRDQMAYIVSAPDPLFAAAEINIQKEFDANTQRIKTSSDAKGKRLVYLVGISVETPAQGDTDFSETGFIPWQAFVQDGGGECKVLNQAALIHKLKEASPLNPDEIDLDVVLRQLESDEEGPGFADD